MKFAGNLNAMSVAGVNWSDVNTLTTQGINWVDVQTLTQMGVNGGEGEGLK